MTRLVLHEAARWVRATGAPLAVLAIVVVTPHLVPNAADRVLRLIPDRALSVAWLGACAAALAWLLTACVRAAIQPASDERAAEQLQGLRDRAQRPGHVLVCVLEARWCSPAGQLMTAVDARTGEVRELWLSETPLPVGAFALVVGRTDVATLVDCIHPRELAGARRAERIAAVRRTAEAAEAARISSRYERNAAAEVVRAAERLLRRT